MERGGTGTCIGGIVCFFFLLTSSSSSSSPAGEEHQERAGAAGEPAEIREMRGYVQLDLPQRRLGAAQPQTALLHQTDLRE